MTDDVRADARRLLQDITPGPWEWHDEGNPSNPWITRKIVRDNEPFHELNVLKVRMARNARDECCWPPSPADAEFIAAAPQLVDRLLAGLDGATMEIEIARAERDAANATLARIQAVAADVDQDGGHSGPSLARTILTIVGGEA